MSGGEVLISKPGDKEDLCIKGDSGEVNETLGLLCLILNIFISGSGTILAGAANSKGLNCKAVLIGIVQFLLVWTLIAWIWSIMHGYHIYVRSKGKK